MEYIQSGVKIVRKQENENKEGDTNRIRWVGNINNFKMEAEDDIDDGAAYI